MCICAEARRDVRSPGAGVTGSSELCSSGTRDRMCVLCASSLRIASVLHHWVISPAPISIFFLKKNMTGGVDGQTGRHTNSQTQERTQNCLPSFFSYKARTRERGQVGISWRRRGSKWWLSLRPKVLAHHTFCLASLYVLSLQSPECAMALAH